MFAGDTDPVLIDKDINYLFQTQQRTSARGSINMAYLEEKLY